MANFNNGLYIKEAIESVISQSYPNWELIIVDDCSTDNSIKMIKPYLTDKRIKLIAHQKNSGYGGSLKTAANHALNIILGILDADDKLHESALETMVQAYKANPDSGFIYSTMWSCDKDLKNCRVNEEIGEISQDNKVFFRERISHFKTFRKEAYNKTSGFDPTQKRAVDKDIIFKLEEVSNCKFINKPLYYYRRHERGISQGKNEFKAILYFYIAKCKAYRRRLGTDIPNVTKLYLWKEFFKITLNRQIKLLNSLLSFFKIYYLFTNSRIKNLIKKIL